MKNIKRILALVIVATMLVAIAIIPASAAETRAVACPCGGMFAPDRTVVGSWSNVGTRSCTHYSYGYDTQQKRTITKYFVCDECRDTYSSKSSEYRWICNGHA